PRAGRRARRGDLLRSTPGDRGGHGDGGVALGPAPGDLRGHLWQYLVPLAAAPLPARGVPRLRPRPRASRAAAAAPDMGGGGGSRPRRGSPRRDTLENRGTAARGGRQHGRGGIPATGTRGSARGPAGAGA